MKKYIKLCRVPHYLKNGLVFLPLIFSKQLWSDNFISIFYGFMAFCFISSVVYILNDIKDIESDRAHPIKRNRPLAAGMISKSTAIMIAMVLFVLSIFFNYLAAGFNINVIGLLLLYFIINIGYSFGLKKVALVDILLLVIGFVLRIYYGASIIDVDVSNWLYLTVMSAAFFLAFGKRRNEILKVGDKTRSVLSAYNKEFLDKNMYVSLVLIIVFYSLWAIEQNIQYLVLTIPLIMLIFMKYTLIIEGDSYGDPIDVLLKDKSLLFLVMLFCISMLYFMI